MRPPVSILDVLCVSFLRWFVSRSYHGPS